jgi:hypothetical protein
MFVKDNDDVGDCSEDQFYVLAKINEQGTVFDTVLNMGMETSASFALNTT